MTNVSLEVPIITAYVPVAGAAFFAQDLIQGLPDWALRDRYDIDAKVSQDDLEEWQKPGSQATMLRAMLQALLADRCKLIVHRDTKDIPVYALVLGKNGPKFKETKPGDTQPAGITLPDGGGVVVRENGDQAIHFYAAPMFPWRRCCRIWRGALFKIGQALPANTTSCCRDPPLTPSRQVARRTA